MKMPMLLESNMSFEAIVKLITDNGLSIICVGYLIYFQSTTMRAMLSTLSTISERLVAIETRIKGGEN